MLSTVRAKLLHSQHQLTHIWLIHRDWSKHIVSLGAGEIDLNYV